MTNNTNNTQTTKTTKKGGTSLTDVLTTIFIILKLTGNISWSWVWVLSPMWIPLVIAIVVIIVTTIVVTKK